MDERQVEVLDNLERVEKIDREGYLRRLQGFDRQLKKAARLGETLSLPAWNRPPAQVLFCGLGGSAIGGDLARAFLGKQCRVPLNTNRNYDIPAYAGPSTLAFVCSYSGNTEETLSAFLLLEQAGTQIICLSSGGRLEQLARKGGHVLLPLPPDMPPRAAIGYMTVPVLVILSRMGLVKDPLADMAEAIRGVAERLDRYRAATPTESNDAKQLACRLHGRITVICGSQDRTDGVARRWAGQFSENGKQLSYFSSLPEMTHNEIVGWKYPAQHLRFVSTVFLRDREDHPRVQLRSRLVHQYLKRRAGQSLEVWSDGGSWLERLWGLVLLGDYTSVYLALLNGEDPTPVEPIEDLKQKMTQKSQEKGKGRGEEGKRLR